ncbi:MAG: hypothetical protein WDZ59_05140 [Pirellulales bacterium]
MELPEEVELVEAAGDTEVNADGQTLQFQPVEEIRPSQRVRWNVTTKAAQQGDVRFRVQVQSQQLRRTTTVEEPTVLFAGEQ